MITIYGKQGCGFCVKAKLLAQSLGMSYQCKDIGVDIIREELYTKHPETKTVPQIWINDKHIGGYVEFASEVEDTGMGNFGEGSLW